MKKRILAIACALSIIVIGLFAVTSEARYERKMSDETEAVLIKVFAHYKEVATENLDTFKVIFEEIRGLGTTIQCNSEFSYTLRLSANGEENTYVNHEIGIVAPKLWNALNTLILKGISTGSFIHSASTDLIAVSLYNHRFGYIILTETEGRSLPVEDWEKLEDDWYIYRVVYGGT